MDDIVHVIDIKDDLIQYLDRHKVKLEDYAKAIEEFRKERGLTDPDAWRNYLWNRTKNVDLE